MFGQLWGVTGRGEMCYVKENIYTCMYAQKMTELSIALCMKLDKNKILQIISRKSIPRYWNTLKTEVQCWHTLH